MPEMREPVNVAKPGQENKFPVPIHKSGQQTMQRISAWLLSGCTQEGM